MEASALAGGLLVETLHESGPLAACRLDKIEGLSCSAIWTGASKVTTKEQILECSETELGKQHFRGTLAHAQVVAVARDAMSIRALDAMHTAGVLGPRSVEERGRRTPSAGFQVGHFQDMKIGILGVGDARLSTKIKLHHCHAVARIRVGPDDESPGLGQDFVRGEDITRRPYLGLAHVQ